MSDLADRPFVHVALDDLEVLLAAVEDLDDLTATEKVALAEVVARVQARRSQLRNRKPIGQVTDEDRRVSLEQGRARLAIIAAAVLSIARDEEWHARSRVVAAVTPLLDNMARQREVGKYRTIRGSPVTARVKHFFQTLETFGDVELRVAGGQAQFRLLDREALEHCVASGGLWPRRPEES